VAVSEEFIRFVIDQLAGFGIILSKRMFGGAGLYRGGTMFALLAGDVLYFKVDDSNRADYEAQGSGPFRPYRDKKTVMSYYEVPVEIVENREELVAWAAKAYAAALRSRRQSPRKQRPDGHTGG
jgi:DNA transformation protein